MTSIKRLCIDLDATICETRLPNQSYTDVNPKPGAVRALKEFKKNGIYIIIYTARHMKTCNNNLGEITAKQGKVVFNWLDKHEIPYDELWFQKPLADAYIDDKAIRFDNNWDEICKNIMENKQL